LKTGPQALFSRRGRRKGPHDRRFARTPTRILLYEDMTMTNIDFSPLFRTMIGFDRLASAM
jgi:hypothetical protein